MSYDNDDNFDYNYLLNQLSINEYLDSFANNSSLDNNIVHTPKKGCFYEHDNRLGIEGEECFNDCSEVLRGNIDTSRSINTSKWIHDKFNSDEQSPKTPQDLIKTYGYDIRKDSKISSRRDNNFSTDYNNKNLFFGDFKVKTKNRTKRKQNKNTNINYCTLQSYPSQLNLNAYILDDDSCKEEIDKIIDNLVAKVPDTNEKNNLFNRATYKNNYNRNNPQAKNKSSHYSRNILYQPKNLN